MRTLTLKTLINKCAVALTIIGLSGCAGTFVKPELNKPSAAARGLDRQ